jgi:hypothetical protein
VIFISRTRFVAPVSLRCCVWPEWSRLNLENRWRSPRMAGTLILQFQLSGPFCD